jgi:hypothetical protein
MIPDPDASLLQTVKGNLTNLNSRSIKFRDHRNHRIGHIDFDTMKKRSHALLPNFGIDEMELVLGSMAKILNDIESHYDQNSKRYDQGAYGSGGAAELIDFITRKQELEDYFDEREFGVEDDEAHAE